MISWGFFIIFEETNKVMSYPEKFKQGFIKQIEKELNKCEIIYNPNTKGIWFVNREEKYWYLEYKVDTNYLWWRYDYFRMFMELFCMDGNVFREIISEWVENKLNGKVDSTTSKGLILKGMVEDTLNCKVDTTKSLNFPNGLAVEDTLNCKVLSTYRLIGNENERVEDTLNCKVESTKKSGFIKSDLVEDTLNCKVLSTKSNHWIQTRSVEDTLN